MFYCQHNLYISLLFPQQQQQQKQQQQPWHFLLASTTAIALLFALA